MSAMACVSACRMASNWEGSTSRDCWSVDGHSCKTLKDFGALTAASGFSQEWNTLWK